MLCLYALSHSFSFLLSWSPSGGFDYQHILQRLFEEPEDHQGCEDDGRALQQGSGD